ncbi:hypothetical protein AV530_000648 [Patagioenas fasciata monilis]|uniref:Uncharacterized protein n=1 Tax=Patagioenas fasciata monilis TaxID=372326 RepID=A0A1V4IGW3_PATFA|nr:hypothetical protein AV530_000648 [Patagioenas fasciata monilis]
MSRCCRGLEALIGSYKRRQDFASLSAVSVLTGLRPEPRGNLNSPQAACEGAVGAIATPRNSVCIVCCSGS